MPGDAHDSLSIKQQTALLAVMSLRIVLCLNFLRFGLSFNPKFEGTAESSGYADTFFNPHHTDGFRNDFLWLFFTTLLIVGALPWLYSRAEERRLGWIDFLLSATWIVAFVAYVMKILSSGLLWFG